jgi:hypothetical protein
MLIRSLFLFLGACARSGSTKAANKYLPAGRAPDSLIAAMSPEPAAFDLH